MTTQDHIRAARESIEAHDQRGTRSEADRHLSIALTHLEDAALRVHAADAGHLDAAVRP